MTVTTKIATGAAVSAGAPFNGSWTNEQNARVASSDATAAGSNTYATAAPGKNQEYASLWPFVFSEVGASDTINSVTVKVQWKVSTTSSIATLQSTTFADNGAGSPDQATALSAAPGVSDAAEPLSDTDRTYTATCTAAQLRQGIWVRVQALRGNTNTAYTASLDYIQVTVDHSAPSISPTRGLVAWAELQAPFTPTRGRVSWAEMEAPLTPTRGLIAWAEAEAPIAPSRGLISWAEQEVVSGTPDPTRGYIEWAELETGLVPTRGLIGWLELEVPDGATRGYIAWAELGVPDVVNQVVMLKASGVLQPGMKVRIVYGGDSWRVIRVQEATGDPARVIELDNVDDMGAPEVCVSEGGDAWRVPLVRFKNPR